MFRSFDHRLYASKVVRFLRVHGLDILGTYVGTLVLLVWSNTTSATHASLLSLLVAAALVVAKQFNAPAPVDQALQNLETKVSGKQKP
jgi:hypothetical protein